MDNNTLWYMEKRIDRTIKNLNRRNMDGLFVKDKNELITLLKKLIDDNSTVGV
ncbi:MAG TPA: lactate utilization protein, partial [Clostridium sp.]|nr:lactate utilization protein [Clostridium sp.]